MLRAQQQKKLPPLKPKAIYKAFYAPKMLHFGWIIVDIMLKPFRKFYFHFLNPLNIQEAPAIISLTVCEPQRQPMSL